MVDVKRIENLLRSHFVCSGTVAVDPRTGVVDVSGDVLYDDKHGPIARFPVQFGSIHGRLNCSDAGLTSLEGGPTHVQGSCWIHNNLLTSLRGGPKIVGRHFWCFANLLKDLQGGPTRVGYDYDCDSNPLESLEGAPDHVGDQFICGYSKSLPLLKLLNYSTVSLEDAPDAVAKIIGSYTGQGLAGSFACAHELELAGFKENASW